MRLFAGIMAASVIALAAWRVRALSSSGAVAAGIIGTAALTAGWDWGIMLITYFVANTLVSRIGAARKIPLLSGIVAKGAARDHAQVFANGLVFLLAALAHIVAPSSLAMVAGAAALAASAADTWATEIGTLSTKRPRLILTGRHVAPGESGGVTPSGHIAALAGSLLISALAIVLGMPVALWPAIVVGGMAGSIVDSVLGASLQHKLWCGACGRITEREIHSCGARTMHHSGMPWVDNDLVNFLSTVAGAGVALLIAVALGAGSGLR